MRNKVVYSLALIVLIVLFALSAAACSHIGLTGFLLESEEIVMYEEEKEQLQVKFFPTNASNKNVFWYSENDVVASVDRNGLVTAINAGMTRIYAESYDGEFIESCAVTVYKKDRPVTEISILFDGEKKQTFVACIDDEPASVTVAVEPANAFDSSYTLVSSDEKIVKCGADGKLVYGSVGKATLTATSNDKQKSFVTQITIVPTVARTMSLARTTILGRKNSLPVKLTPIFNSPYVADKTVVYTINGSAARVDENGYVYFIENGEATITATHVADGLKAYCTVKVKEPVYIKTAAELQALDKIVTSADTLYMLKNDIDCSALSDFDPIGYDGGDDSPADSRKFAATLDGNGFAIKNLTVNRADKYNIGLFVYVGSTGNVRNLTIDSANINGRITGTVCGCNEGVIENCLIKNCTVTASYNWNGITAASNASTGLIVNCIAANSFVSDKAVNFALVGRNYGAAENCLVSDGLLSDTVKNNGMSKQMLSAAYAVNCDFISDEELSAASVFARFPAQLWNIADGVIPSLKSSADMEV